LKSNLYLVRKTLLWITFLQMLIANQIALASASPETMVKVEPYASTASVGETLIINITLTDVQNLYGLEIVLNWNASVLKMVAVDVRLGFESHPDGVLHEILGTAPISFYKNETLEEQGKYILAASSTAPAASFNGSGNIVKITFNVTNRGNTKLGLESKLDDKPTSGSVASPIAHTTTSGVFSPIHVFISPATVTLGENVNISGFIALAQANVNVTIQYRREGETDWHNLPVAKTSRKGNYQHMWQPTEGGKYEIRATAFFDDLVETSYSVYITVKALAQLPVWQYIPIIIAIVLAATVIAMLMYRKRIQKAEGTA